MITGDSAMLPPTCALADVLLMGQATGWLSPPLRRLAGTGERVAARAFTVEVQPCVGGGGLGRLFELVDSGDLEGRALVLGGADQIPGAVWGEILTIAAQRAAATVLVIDGLARDLGELAADGPAVWARGECTVGPGRDVRLVAAEGPVVIGDTTVASDDLVLADPGGLVALRSAMADEALGRARQYAEAEALVVADLLAGRPAKDAYEAKRRVVQALQELGPL